MEPVAAWGTPRVPSCAEVEPSTPLQRNQPPSGVLSSSLSTTGRPLAERGSPAPLQESLGVQDAIELDGLGYDPGPAGLMARPQPRPVVAVEILVEEQEIPPV